MVAVVNRNPLAPSLLGRSSVMGSSSAESVHAFIEAGSGGGKAAERRNLRSVGEPEVADRSHTEVDRSRAVYLRRRVAFGLALAVVAVVLMELAALGAGLVGALAGASLPDAGSDVATVGVDGGSIDPIYVVRDGDTLWELAGRLQPVGDRRPLVDAMVAANSGASLTAGQQLVLPAQAIPGGVEQAMQLIEGHGDRRTP